MELRRGRSRPEGPGPEQPNRFVRSQKLISMDVSRLGGLFQFSASLAASRSARTMRATISGILTVGRRSDLAGHEADRPKRRFMIKEESRTGKESVRLPVVGHQGNGRRLGNAVRALRPERRLFIRRAQAGITKALGGAGIVKPHSPAETSQRREHIERAKRYTCQCLGRLS